MHLKLVVYGIYVDLVYVVDIRKVVDGTWGLG